MIVGVMGSGQQGWMEFTVPLGRFLAESGYHCLTGGGGGVMTSVAKAFCCTIPRVGLSIGVVPSVPTVGGGYEIKEGYPNPYIEIVINSPLGTFTGETENQIGRNHINIMTSHVVIALPGGKGTRNECRLALQMQKPLILFGPIQEFADFNEQIPKTESMDEIKNWLAKKQK